MNKLGTNSTQTTAQKVVLIAMASVLLGVGACFIQWTSKAGIQAQGYPVPVIIHQKSATTGQLVETLFFPGFILNPLSFFLMGVIFFFLWTFVRGFAKRSRGGLAR